MSFIIMKTREGHNKVDLSDGPNVSVNHAARAANLRAQADAEDAAQVAKEAKDALLSRITYEDSLADATKLLLACVRKLATLGEGVGTMPMDDFVTFRKELTPLAESYGYKFVLVGDKTKAALTVL